MSAEQCEANEVSLCILAKAPIAGFAKTRLIPALGAQGAARLQDWLLQKTLDTVRMSGMRRVILWGAPDHHQAAFQDAQMGGALELRSQPAGDLGFRMHWAIRQAAPALVIGTDCPALTPALLNEAAQALHTHDAVVIPAADGGYVLIGMREATAQVFVGVDWGTSAVMAQTRSRMAAMRWKVAELAPLWDVDTAADLPRLRHGFPDAPVDDGEANR